MKVLWAASVAHCSRLQASAPVQYRNFITQGSVLPGFQGNMKIMYFTPVWHLRKHHCYRSYSVCYLLSADPHRNLNVLRWDWSAKLS